MQILFLGLTLVDLQSEVSSKYLNVTYSTNVAVAFRLYDLRQTGFIERDEVSICRFLLETARSTNS